jgi:hypothetical protein
VNYSEAIQQSLEVLEGQKQKESFKHAPELTATGPKCNLNRHSDLQQLN